MHLFQPVRLVPKVKRFGEFQWRNLLTVKNYTKSKIKKQNRISEVPSSYSGSSTRAVLDFHLEIGLEIPFYRCSKIILAF